MSTIQQLFAGIEVILYEVVLAVLPIVLLFILLNFLVSVYAENDSGTFLKVFDHDDWIGFVFCMVSIWPMFRWDSI